MHKYSSTSSGGSAAQPARPRRLSVLTRLLRERQFSSQEELVTALGKAGISVTQATLSRDLRSLGVVRRPGPGGRAVYELPGPAADIMDRERQSLDLRAFINEVRLAQNLVVVKTPPGHAHAVGRAIDLLEFSGVVGTVAGDDTVLVVSLDATNGRRFKRHLDSLAVQAGRNA